MGQGVLEPLSREQGGFSVAARSSNVGWLEIVTSREDGARLRTEEVEGRKDKIRIWQSPE